MTDDGTEPPPDPMLPPRITINTGPIPRPNPTATVNPLPARWLEDQPYGASPHARYAAASPQRSGRVTRLLLLLLVLALVAGGALLFRDRLFGDDPPRYPAEWDPRVADIAAFVTAERELPWLHPVYVDFLPEAQFVALFDQPSAPSSEQVLAAQRASDLYDAFALAVEYDPLQGESTMSAVSTLGFYSPTSDRVTIRGDRLTAAVRVVLAHELTHALQAQHFDLTPGGANDLALRSVVEADALRVDEVYRSTLTPAEQAEVDTDNTVDVDGDTALAGVPWAVVEQRFAPYVLGPLLVRDVFANAGNDGINELLRSPPTEELLLNPWLLGTEQAERDVIVEVPDGATVIDPPQSLSPVRMLVMLDAWLPWRQSRAALDGWAGGAYASFERNGTVCFRATAAFDDSGDRFAAAITAWATAAGSSASPSVVVNDISFEACARGPGAEAPPEPIVPPLRALVIERDAVDLAGPNPSVAEIDRYRCFAATVIDDPLVAALLLEPELTGDESDLLTWQSTIAANTCGVPPPRTA